MAIVVVRWLDSAGELRTGNLQQLPESRGARWRWIDVSPIDADTLGILTAEFGLHPLLVEDTLHHQVRSKFDPFPDSSFIAWLYLIEAVDGQLRTGELDVFLGSDFLITLHDSEIRSIDEVTEELLRRPTLGPDWILHAIIDRLVDSLLPYVDQIGDELDEIEDVLIDKPSTEDLQRLYSIRRRLVRLHRLISPEREVIRGLARERNFISEDAYRYFQDVGDHLEHVEDTIGTYRDVGAAAMDIYLSAINNRMNAIMKQLTVVATIFMPLTLISGIYGMNLLRGMWPPAGAHWSFTLVMALMLAIALAMALFFRRKKWW